MKSKATTVAAYVDSLPPGPPGTPNRRDAIQTVRRVILDNLDKGLQECMQYGVIAYCVPHSGEGGWPYGHHTNPQLPLMYMGLSSQKNDMVVYMLFLMHNKREREWFDRAWKATGRKNDLEVSGAGSGGCCLRFKKVEDLSLDVIAGAMRRMPVKKYLEGHIAMLARIGKGPDGKPLRKTEGAAKGKGGAEAKDAPPPPPSRGPKRKAAKKKAGAKRG